MHLSFPTRFWVGQILAKKNELCVPLSALPGYLLDLVTIDSGAIIGTIGTIGTCQWVDAVSELPTRQSSLSTLVDNHS